MECSHCHYNEIVSGGEEIGKEGAVCTYHCLNCKILFDWHNEKPFKLSKDILFCPICMTPKIEAWDYETGVCPKCCHRMEIIGIMEFL